MSDPKENSFFCPLPWKHLSIEPNGKVFACCNSKPSDSLGDLKVSSISEVWKGENIGKLRKQFLNGMVPEQCETCVFQEQNGQVSLREASLVEYPLTSEDLDQVHEPAFLGLRFGNTCNMSCRICSSGLSTSWYGDEVLLGKTPPTGRVHSFNDSRFQELLSLVEKSGETLYFAGGEPLLQPEFSSLLNFLVDKNRTDIRLMINSNGSISVADKKELKESLCSFENVLMEVSLDDFGKRAEYSRKGTNWELILNNLNEFKNMGFDLYITPTISIFNIFYLDVFLKYLLSDLEINPRNIRMTVLREPSEYNISILPQDVKDTVCSKMNILQKDLLKQFDLEHVAGLISELNSIKQALVLKNSKSEINDFLKKTKALDQIRDEDFSETFSELFSLLDK